MLEIDYRTLRPWAVAYVALPLSLFVALWLRLVAALPLFVSVVLAVILSAQPTRLAGRISKGRLSRMMAGTPLFEAPMLFALGKGRRSCKQRTALLSPGAIAALAFVAVAWCVLGGHGGFWAQSSDWNVRNAVFRDLITHGWPVRYNGGEAAMSYYMAYWLPAALMAKVPFKLGLSIEAIWPLANIVLLAWTAAGMFIVELLALITLGIRSGRQAVLCIIALILFSTPDILGLPITGKWDDALTQRHLEWWATGQEGVGQYSSITTCLFWVFNQSVVPWVCTLCFLNERRFSNYLFLWCCCFCCGPFPSIGLAALMLAQGMGVLLRRERMANLKRQLASIVSIPNAVGLICAAVVALFFLANAATAHTGETAGVENLLSYPLWLPDNRRMVITALLLVAIEGLPIPACLFQGNRRKPLYWCIVATLMLCPFIRIGQAADFCMRASIPALLCLYALCMQQLIEWAKDGKPHQLATWALIACLALGVFTPAMEFYRGFYQVATMGIENVHPDLGTLDGRDFSKSNFGTDRPDDTLFYQYLAGD